MHLQNWRPTSLSNCDTKIFTRLLNQRSIETSLPLINQNRLAGFMPNRFITENGLITKLIMENAKYTKSQILDY